MGWTQPLENHYFIGLLCKLSFLGNISENPRVVGSIPTLATISKIFIASELCRKSRPPKTPRKTVGRLFGRLPATSAGKLRIIISQAIRANPHTVRLIVDVPSVQAEV